MGPAATTTVCELNDTVPWMDVAARSDHWSLLGAKPKAPVSSTPSQREPWTDVCRGKHRGKLICRPTPPRALQLTNGYSILGEEDFPPPPVIGLNPRRQGPVFPCRRRLHSARLRPDLRYTMLTAALGGTPPSRVQAPCSSPLDPLQQTPGSRPPSRTMADIGPPVRLLIILNDDNSVRLEFRNGIPKTMEELIEEVKN
ncbi:hypothetical protein JOQ06_027531 [Pogonophryne albipinna]|uniref:Uncharacterized protein n=1 Tax=Pogonophryne albipinna TaxID=1090488 RepID=A0AAD6FQ60_9TELE|nr:hypothetical protein JOQ06_027531 [Pogonophryne albipinna]